MDVAKEIIRPFVDWIKIKIKLHIDINERELYFYEKQIWWASIGQNVGSEQNGKNDNFERPILVLKKFNEDTLWAIMASSKIRSGRYYTSCHLDDKEFSLNLSQLRLISSRRLLRLVGMISLEEFELIRDKVKDIV